MNAIPPGSPFNRLPRGRPELPAQILDLSDEEYAEQLRKFGFGEDAVARELEMFKAYVGAMRAKSEPASVEEGPTKGRLYKAWTRSTKARRTREEGDNER